MHPDSFPYIAAFIAPGSPASGRTRPEVRTGRQGEPALRQRRAALRQLQEFPHQARKTVRRVRNGRISVPHRGVRSAICATESHTVRQQRQILDQRHDHRRQRRDFGCRSPTSSRSIRVIPAATAIGSPGSHSCAPASRFRRQERDAHHQRSVSASRARHAADRAASSGAAFEIGQQRQLVGRQPSDSSHQRSTPRRQTSFDLRRHRAHRYRWSNDL